MTAPAIPRSTALTEAGRALSEIHDQRLYRTTHETFEGYCRDNFGLFGTADPFTAVTQPGVADAISRASKARTADARGWAALVGEAFQRRDWEVLGYQSWDAYLAGEMLVRNYGAPRRPKPDQDTRSVYFIQAVSGGLIKIGVAADPVARLAEIQRMCPIPLRILSVLPGVGQPGEAALHRRFAAARRHGEWFEPTAELLREVTA